MLALCRLVALAVALPTSLSPSQLCPAATPSSGLVSGFDKCKTELSASTHASVCLQQRYVRIKSQSRMVSVSIVHNIDVVLLSLLVHCFVSVWWWSLTVLVRSRISSPSHQHNRVVPTQVRPGPDTQGTRRQAADLPSSR